MTDISLKFYDHSNVFVECSDSIFFELRDYFSFEADGYRFNPKFKYGQWDGRIRLLEHNHLLPFGLALNAKKFALEMGYSIHIDPQISEKEELAIDDFNKWLDSKEIYSGSTKIKPHWYQSAAVYEAIVNRRKILNLPTSAGKSLIQALLSRYYLENYEGRVLILVPTTALVTQMKDDFVDYRLFNANNIAEVRGGKKPTGNELVVVSTWQTAIKQGPEWFAQFGMLLCDEMHLAVGKSISTIIKGLNNCMFKVGLSGSLRDGKANLMQYVGLFGDIYKPVSTSQLMEDGQVTDLKINALFLKYPKTVSTAVAKFDYASEIKFITKLQKRTNWIANLSIKLGKRNENVFVMFKNIEHGKAIFEAIKSTGYKNVYYVSGEISSDQRTELKKMAEENTGVVIIASYGVFSTGISVKNLHHVILAHGVKSKIIVLQTIGRVLRKHKSKSVATIWDIVDDMSVSVEKNGTKHRKNINYLLKHGIDRVERYASEKFNYTIKDVYFLGEAAYK